MTITDRGELLLGANAIAEAVYGDADKRRLLYSGAVRRQLGLFLLGGRLCGFRGVIDRELNRLATPEGLRDDAA